MKTIIFAELEKSIEDAKEDLKMAKNYKLLIELWNNRKEYTFVYKDINNDDKHVIVNLFEGISFSLNLENKEQICWIISMITSIH